MAQLSVVSQDMLCIDSDDGIDYYVKGTQKCNGINYTEACYDYTLTELYCGELSTCYSISYVCAYGCEDGACKTVNTSSLFPEPYTRFNENTIIVYGKYADVNEYNYCVEALNATGLTVKNDMDVGVTDKNNHNMILIGKPSDNLMTSELAGNDMTANSTEWESSLADSYIVHIVEDAYGTGKDVLVLAGAAQLRSMEACAHALSGMPVNYP